MNFDRAFGQIQAVRYELVRMTATDQSHDLLLTASEYTEPHFATLCFTGTFHGIHAQSLGALPKIAT
jgi:hypothetical protein